MNSISIIKREHRSLGAMLFTLEGLVDEIGKHHKTVHFDVFHGIAYYLDSFLDRYHHPKETEYLFPAVRARCPEAAPVLDRLAEQHEQGERMLDKLLKALSAYEFLGEPGFARFGEAVKEYVEFERSHAMAEEKEVLPLAVKHLNASDWARIDAAFADNQDPMFGDKPRAEFRQLFTKLGNLIPAPYGLGPELDHT